MIAVAQFLLGGGFGHLLVDFAARVGVFEDELGHDLFRPRLGLEPGGPSRQLELELFSSMTGFTRSLANRKIRTASSWPLTIKAVISIWGDTVNSTCLYGNFSDLGFAITSLLSPSIFSLKSVKSF